MRKIDNYKIPGLNFSTPLVMGILNVTPDSFYSGSRYDNIDKAIEATEKMLEEGVNIIDIGGMSSRPGSDFIPVEVESSRVIPVLKELRKRFSGITISIDTFRAQIAEKALQNGADIINDISAGTFDEKIIDVVAGYQVPYIFMHIQGIPKNMQINPQYENIVEDILKFMFKKVRYLKSRGIDKPILDPGFGFGKTLDDNYKLMKNLDIFKILEIPVLVGISRKSMLYKLLNITPEESLNATTAMNAIALIKGADIIRVHDVKEAKETVALIQKLV